MDIQIITYDSYQTSPTKLDKSNITINGNKESALSSLKFKNVPILRIYGKLPTYHSCLLHIHDVFPYLYVHFPQANGWKSKNLSKEQTADLIKWVIEINSAMSLSYKRGFKRKKTNTQKKPKVDNEKDDGEENEDNDDIEYFEDIEDDESGEESLESNMMYSYISDISVVTGVPFYGYHLQYSTFLKISLVSPKYITRLSKLLGESKIFGKFIQPYESHIPYILQFLIDYNCYTLKYISTTNYLWRTPLSFLDDSFYNSKSFQPFFETNFTYFNTQKVDTDFKDFINTHIYKIDNNLNVLNPELFPRIGRSMVEMDIISSWIQNRNSLEERHISQLNYHLSQDDNIQYISSTKSLLDDVENLRRARGLQNEFSQLGLFDTSPRPEYSINWNEQADLEKLFQRCLKLSEESYLKKYHDKDFKRLKHPQPKLIFPTSFQHIDCSHYIPDLSNDILINSTVIDEKLNDAFDLLLLYSKSFKLSNSEIIENNLNISDNEERYSDIENNTDDDENSKVKSHIEDEQLIEDHDENEKINESNSNITLKLLDASIADESVVSNNSDIRFLESFNLKKSIPELVSLTQREKSKAQEEEFVNFFKDIDYVERIYTFDIQQPTAESKDEFLNSLETDYHLLKVEYPDPYFSKLSNFDSNPFIFAGEKFQLDCSEIDSNLYPSGHQLQMLYQPVNESIMWKYTPKMPACEDVKTWMKEVNLQSNPPSFNYESQIKGPTQKYKGYKYSSLKTPPERINGNSMSQILLLVEIHINTREEKMPDPEQDEISAIFWGTNKENFMFDTDLPESGIFINSKSNQKFLSETENEITCYDNELDMIIGLVSLVEYLDPDILSGFELHALSWGYIIERVKYKYSIDICRRLSRVVYKHNNKVGDRYGYTHASGIKITGRQLFNVWRRLRSELTLNHYSLENIVFHIFHERIPSFSWKQLSTWWKSNDEKHLSYVINYHSSRINYVTNLIKKLELIEKVNEQSRLLGIDFYSMIYRGSQFKVECLLVRLSKAENFMLISPSKKQVFKQDSLECIPLVMEPNSAFYKSPLVVLDFQSLYPSLIIAYNICYSTMLGKLKNYDPSKYTKMGVTNYKSPEGILKILEKDINITPNGIMFVKQNIRKSLLARMLIEILNARIYIKNTMNEFKDDYELQKLYNNRQLALKLIANVTYGYTSASYSGRMPNSDIADAIVSCGRETLLKAVKEIENNSQWGAKVVYGDTDSLFVYLPGKTKDDAFRIGKEMANHVTLMNPEPIKLKFEKVYLPSILVSKKRYIGWKYEFEKQEKPQFDAKGIETVRRDGIPAQQKILEKAITLLFKTRDISLIKEYIIEQFVKIVKNKINIQDFLFAKEVRLGTYKNEKYIPPGARLSMKRKEKDHRTEPQYKERVFYIVRKGHNKEILRDRCVSPDEFLNNSGMELDSEYYINKVLVPPLERIFNLLGVDIRSWVKEIPQVLSYSGVGITLLNVRVMTCLCCGKSSNINLQNSDYTPKICDNCKKDELNTFLVLKKRVIKREQKATNYIKFCISCSGKTLGEQVRNGTANECCNVDCSVFYSRVKTFKDTNKIIEEYQELPDW